MNRIFTITHLLVLSLTTLTITLAPAAYTAIVIT